VLQAPAPAASALEVHLTPDQVGGRRGEQTCGSKKISAAGEHYPSGVTVMNERGWRKKLKSLPPAARRDLLKVLLSDSTTRADVIRQFYEREDTRNLAEVVMDLESDDLLRLTVIGLIDRLEQKS
jgi:hypothetical protein